MREATVKGEEAAQQLWNLIPVDKWTKGSSEDGCQTQSQLDAIEELDAKDGARTQTIDA